MIHTSIFPGRYVQGAGAIDTLGEELARFGASGLVICDPFVAKEVLPEFREALSSAVSVTVETFGGECSEDEVERLSALRDTAGGDFVVGIGGGKTLDSAKAVAAGAGLPSAVVPTIASTDAPCSSLAIIYNADGSYKRDWFLHRNPNLVLVDTAIVARAPVRFLVSGMGDALSTWFEAESCRRAYAPNMTGHVGTDAAYAIARLCYDNLLEYGLAAKLSCEAGVVTEALEHIVEANTLLSGIGFESVGVASAHSVHNGLTALRGTHAFYHGEKVAFGVLSDLFLTDRPRAVIDEVYGFCESVGLPTTLAELGLAGVSDEELMLVARKACGPDEVIHNEPIPLDPRSVLAAMKLADAAGRERQRQSSKG